MSKYLPYDEIKITKNVKLEDIINTPDDSDIGYFLEVDLKYPDNIKEKTKNFPFSPENKKKLIPTNSLHLWKKTNQIFIQKLRD